MQGVRRCWAVPMASCHPTTRHAPPPPRCSANYAASKMCSATSPKTGHARPARPGNSLVTLTVVATEATCQGAVQRRAQRGGARPASLSLGGYSGFEPRSLTEAAEATEGRGRVWQLSGGAALGSAPLLGSVVVGGRASRIEAVPRVASDDGRAAEAAEGRGVCAFAGRAVS